MSQKRNSQLQTKSPYADPKASAVLAVGKNPGLKVKVKEISRVQHVVGHVKGQTV